ncbi:MAG TPA: hypothetical protein DDY98_06390 [Ruminococcaceae bacterium]|nr:hypothetical protein [Oscillospiraceae bacterium]
MQLFQTIINYLLVGLFLVQSALGLPIQSLLFRFDAKASVFETGDDMYTVMWSTTCPGSGYVTYTFNGKEFIVTDQENGNIRSTDTIHSVRVPKAHLDHNTYVYHSQLVATKQAYSAVKGGTISSEPVRFNGYGEQEEIHVLTLSDIHENPNPVDEAIANFKDKADLLVLNGDITSSMVSSKTFLKVLQYAYRYSGGQIPVAYTRGNHETRGEFASEMPKYFKTTTGGLFYTFRFGSLQFLALDSGEDKEDSHKEYSGLVDFTSYIAEETKWLNALPSSSNAQASICLVHQPDLEDRYGNNWLPLLTAWKTDAVICGHYHRLDLNFRAGTAPFFRIIDGGESDSGFVATMLIFKGSTMKAVSYDEKGTLCGEKAYTLTE